MKAAVWRVEDDGEAQLPGSPTAEAGLVSLPFLLAAVRRGWRRVALAAVVCALLALGLAQALAGQPAATATLLVVSDPNLDPSSAMATNLTLLGTRKVAQEAVAELGQGLTADGFRATVTGGALSDQLMTVTVTAPSRQQAVHRANTMAAVYLAFRAQQLSASADSTIRANQQRIDALNKQVDDLTTRYDRAASTPGQEQVAATLGTQRAQLQAEVTQAQQDNTQTQLQNEAINGASHVIDSAAVVEKSHLKASVLAFVSGLVGGTALGLMWVLAPAVLSTKLRRRDDVARALGIPVRFSAGRVRSPRWWPTGRQRQRHAQRLAHGLATALDDDVDLARLTLATVGDVRDGAYVIGALADALAVESARVAVVDLSSSGALAEPSWFQIARRDPIRNRQLVQVRRREVRVSQLAGRSRTAVPLDKDLSRAEVILTLIELDLGAGIDILGELADAAVVLVSAGEASAERLRSSATLLRQSQIRPAFAMLVGADDTDDSSGMVEPARGGDVSARRSS